MVCHSSEPTFLAKSESQASTEENSFKTVEMMPPGSYSILVSKERSVFWTACKGTLGMGRGLVRGASKGEEKS